MGNEIFFISIIILGFALVIFFIRKSLADLQQKQKPSEEILEWLKSTSKRLDDQNKNFIGTLQTNTKSLNERLDKAAEVIGKVRQNIGEMSEIGRGMKEIQEFLQSPKLRGNIGEQVLKELLNQQLPKQTFHLQYAFKNGSVVDAAIKTSNGIIPIDSKFPMENFRKMNKATDKKEQEVFRKVFINDVKKHLRAIASKYIVTEEGTIDYAVMYIPSEAVYYEIVNDEELFEYASSNHVMPVSPMTFYAFLRTVLVSFEGQKIEQKAKQILVNLKAIQKDYNQTEENFGILGRHFNNAYNMLGTVGRSFQGLGQRITQTSNLDFQEKKQIEQS